MAAGTLRAITTPVSAPTCFRHPDRPTGRACTRCGRPACTECLVQAAVGSQCVECVRSARPAAPERIRRQWAGITTPITKALIAANVIVFVIGLSGGSVWDSDGSVQTDLGLFGPAVQDGEWYRIITSGFTHAGLLHLGLNMYFIWIIGQMLERAIGSMRFTLLYFAALLAGSAGAMIADPLALTVGASGAAFGLLGAAVVGMRQRGVAVMQSQLGVLLVLNLVLTFAIPGIAIGGHIGGLVGGGICGTALLAPRRERAWWELVVPVVVMVASVALCYWAAYR
jgi:membrane associated rhomboid family serine protease